LGERCGHLAGQAAVEMAMVDPVAHLQSTLADPVVEPGSAKDLAAVAGEDPIDPVATGLEVGHEAGYPLLDLGERGVLAGGPGNPRQQVVLVFIERGLERRCIGRLPGPESSAGSEDLGGESHRNKLAKSAAGSRSRVWRYL